jgi:hypothetical protein
MKNVSYKIVLAIILLATILPANAQKRSFLATAQYAGSIGYLSIGGGITSRNHKFHNELLYGFVPSYYGGPLNKVSYKLTYYPLQLKIGNTVQWQPISIGGMLSYNLDKGFTMVPSLKKYDRDYYWWSSGLRKHITVSSSITIRPKDHPQMPVLFYVEANTNDLYLMTLYDNVGEMPFDEIWFLGMGVKMIFD